MATIKFTTNLPLNSDPNWSKPWLFDPKYFDSIPDKPGVYIVGVKIPVFDPKQFEEKGEQINKVEKFCPLYVGTHKNSLRSRIKGHWDRENKDTIVGTLNSFKELFDLSLSPNKFYKGIEIWNKEWKHKKNSVENLNNLFSEIKEHGHKSLIWFPDMLFFDHYLSSGGNHISPISNWHNNTAIKNDNFLKLSKTTLLKKINDAKDKISNKYWYAYSVVDKDDKNLLSEIEANANIKLQGYGVWTYAYSKKNIRNCFDIDLTAIKDDLVNMTGKPFPLTSKKFII